MMDFEAAVEFQKVQYRPYCGVRYIFNSLPDFGLGPNDAELMLKERGQVSTGNIAVLINSGSKHSPTVFFEPIRIIGATAKKRNSKRGTAYNHCKKNLMKVVGENDSLPFNISESQSLPVSTSNAAPLNTHATVAPDR
jgi:hypothetical protein